MKYLLPWETEHSYSFQITYNRKELQNNKVHTKIVYDTGTGIYICNYRNFTSLKAAQNFADCKLISEGYYLIAENEMEKFNKLRILI